GATVALEECLGDLAPCGVVRADEENPDRICRHRPIVNRRVGRGLDAGGRRRQTIAPLSGGGGGSRCTARRTRHGPATRRTSRGRAPPGSRPGRTPGTAIAST